MSIQWSNSGPKPEGSKGQKRKEESVDLVDSERHSPLLIKDVKVESPIKPEKNDPGQGQRPVPSPQHLLLVIGALSIPGCLLRVALVHVSEDWIGVPASPSLLANLLGCWILGIVTSWPSFKKHKAAAKAVGTGLCGSITTFSMYSHETKTLWRDYGAGTYLFCIFMTTLSCIGAFLLGEIFGELAEKIWHPRAYIWSPLGYLVVAGVCFPLSTLSFFDNPDLWIALLLSPPGAMLRFLLGRYLNKMDPRSVEPGRYPKYNIFLGTILANGSGSLLYLFLQHTEVTGFILGITTGFCGCFTTVSTFISETISLGKIRGSRWRALLYQVGTHLVAVVLPLIIELVWEHFENRR